VLELVLWKPHQTTVDIEVCAANPDIDSIAVEDIDVHNEDSHIVPPQR